MSYIERCLSFNLPAPYSCFLWGARKRGKSTFLNIFDTGRANYLKRYQYREMRGVDAEKAFEHYVFLELIAYHLMKEKREKLYYWRTKDGIEVDFVLQDGQIAIEGKILAPIDRRDLK